MSKIIQVKEDVFAVPFFRKGAFGGIDARQPDTPDAGSFSIGG